MYTKPKQKKIITICSSASFYREVLEIEEALKGMGYKVKVPSTARKMKKNNDFNVAKYKTWFKNKKDYKKKTKLMKEHFRKVLEADAILVVNNTKNNIAGYIGGNLLMEMALAFQNRKPIYILNHIEEVHPFIEEILGLNPIFLDSDISKIRE